MDATRRSHASEQQQRWKQACYSDLIAYFLHHFLQALLQSSEQNIPRNTVNNALTKLISADKVKVFNAALNFADDITADIIDLTLYLHS